MSKKALRTEKLQKEVFIKCIEKGASFALASRATGLSRSYIFCQRRDRTEFGQQIDLAVESRIIIVEDALLKSAKKGNVIAMIFWLKNRGKGKWKEKQEFEVNEIRTIKVKAFIQAGEEPVIKEEDPERIEEATQGEGTEDTKEIETVL